MIQHCCKQMASILEENDVAISYIAKFRQYGIDYNDGGSSLQSISYCPWCGNKLPSTLRDQWFDVLEKELGREVEIGEKETIPAEFLDETWWIKRNL